MKNLFFLIGLFLFSHSDVHSQSCDQLSRNYFVCGVSSHEFDFSRARSMNNGQQIQSNWCWAACVQMVLNYHGLHVSQTDVVTRIYGSVYANEPANEYQMKKALSGWAPDNRGRVSKIKVSSDYSYSAVEIINLLSNKWPLIVGLSGPNGGTGHAYVLTAIYYSNKYDYYGNIVDVVPEKVVLRNPWPGSSSKETMSWAQFNNQLDMAFKVWVERW